MAPHEETPKHSLSAFECGGQKILVSRRGIKHKKRSESLAKKKREVTRWGRGGSVTQAKMKEAAITNGLYEREVDFANLDTGGNSKNGRGEFF